uniref:Rho GTPase activating protein 29 n=1 Tax=Pavo cristatus TaxID=9049 RepID=A0A8C9EQ73_PAVCR
MLRQNGGSNKRGLGLARLSTSNFFTISNSGNWGMGRGTKSSSLSSISSNSDCYDNPVVDPEYIMQLVNDVRKFADVLLYLKEAICSEGMGEVLHRKSSMVNLLDSTSHPLVLIFSLAVNFKEVNEENKRELFSEVFSSIETLAFTFGNIISDFLMGDVDNGSSLGLPVSRRSRCVVMSKIHSFAFDALFSGHLRAEEVDSMLLSNDSGIESALSYAKAWSKYTKDVVAWVEKKLSLEVECAKNLAKMAETAKAVVGPQDYMPFQSIFLNAFQNDIENNQLWQQTAAALQSNKFVQPLLGRKNELDRQRKEIKELWQREQKKMVGISHILQFVIHMCNWWILFLKVMRGPPPFRSWSVGNQSGGMCSDSESAGGSSESRSMDSPSASPGDFKRRLPRTPSTGTMSSADDLDEREPPSPSDCGNVVSVPEFPKRWLLSFSVTLLFNELEKNTLIVSDIFMFLQLPEPLILFRLYNEFIGLAKESQNVNEELDAKQASPKSKKRQSICIELNRIIIKIKDLLKQLPVPNYNTLQYLIGHLHRVTEQSDENKMSASNLGIIFGPTLIRPRQTDATVSLSSLVDYPYQARVVELLITYYEKIFDVSLQPFLGTSQTEENAITVRVALSAEEREPQQQRKSFVAVKEVSHFSSSETTALLLESNNSKNAKEQVDASVTASEKDSHSFVSAGEESCKVNLFPAKPNRQITKVPLRGPRTKPAIRPVSLPVERILPPCVLNERNSRNAGAVSPEKLGRSPTIEEVSEVKALPAVNTFCRLSCCDTQMLQKTWDKQYKQYDITARTAMIVTNVPQENRALESGTVGALSSSCSSNSANAILPSKPYSLSVRSGRTATDGNSPSAHPLAAFRAPRTLQPPPGTFYKPPSNKSKQGEKSSVEQAKACASTSASSVLQQDTVKLARSSALSSGNPGQSTNEQKTGSEDTHSTDLKPAYQRLRPKRIQELEHREAHFV